MYYVMKSKKWILLISISLVIAMAGFFVYAASSFLHYSLQTGGYSDLENSSEQSDLILPVLMYHDILKNPATHGEHTISPGDFEADLKYLKEKGYQSIVIQDLVDYVTEGIALPSKPVLITFDDGHFNNVYYAQPLLEQYDMQAVIFVVGAYCEKAVAEGEENPNYSYIQWDRLAQMSKSGIWDVQSHTWNLHSSEPGKRKGVTKKPGETQSQHETVLREDFTKITQKLTEVTGTAPVAFAYPFGFLDDTAETVLKELGYQASFSCQAGKARVVAGEAESLFYMRRMNRSNKKSASTLLSRY